MDGKRFDALARQVALGRVSRRSVIVGALSGAFALFTQGPLGTAAKSDKDKEKKGKHCASDFDCAGAELCCNKRCSDPLDPATCGSCDRACAVNESCCPMGGLDGVELPGPGCINVKGDDPSNCGSCDEGCRSGEV